jgi:hypothetical protein
MTSPKILDKQYDALTQLKTMVAISFHRGCSVSYKCKECSETKDSSKSNEAESSGTIKRNNMDYDIIRYSLPFKVLLKEIFKPFLMDGNKSMIEYFIHDNFFDDNPVDEQVCFWKYAAKGGNLELVKWLTTMRSSVGVTVINDLFYGAAKYGHVEILEWIYTEYQYLELDRCIEENLME